MDPRKDRRAWKKGDAYAIFCYKEASRRPVWWDGDADPLGRTPLGIGHFYGGEFIIVLNENPRPWPYIHTTQVGIDCVWGTRRIWFLVNEKPGAHRRDFDLVKLT